MVLLLMPRLPFSISNVFFVSKCNLFYFYFTTLLLTLVPCGGQKRLPVLYHSTDYIFISFWDHWAHCCIFENGVLLMYTLEGVSSVANFIIAYEESQ